MDRKVAKEFLHLRDWLDRAAVIVSRCEGAYAADPSTPNASLKRPSTGEQTLPRSPTWRSAQRC